MSDDEAWETKSRRSPLRQTVRGDDYNMALAEINSLTVEKWRAIKAVLQAAHDADESPGSVVAERNLSRALFHWDDAGRPGGNPEALRERLKSKVTGRLTHLKDRVERSFKRKHEAQKDIYAFRDAVIQIILSEIKMEEEGR